MPEIVPTVIYPTVAGLLAWVETDEMEDREFPPGVVPKGTNFAIRVSGDSMEPTIPNSAYVFVMQQLEIRNNEIGVFMLYDDACSRMNLPAFKNDFIDTMRLSRRLYSKERHHRLIDLVKRFGIGESIEHRAMADALQTQQCYESIKHYVSENGIDYSSLYPQKRGFNKVSARTIKAETSVFDERSLVYGKHFTFTGTLEKMGRKEAMQFVINVGGICDDSVTKNTNYLVLGSYDYCVGIKDGKSNKRKRAEQLELAGYDIEIISESVFYEMLMMDTEPLSAD